MVSYAEAMKKVIYKAKKGKGKAKKVLKTKINVRLTFLVLILLILTPVFGFQIYFFNKINPGVLIAGLDVGGKSESEASYNSSQKFSIPETVRLVNQSQTFTLYTKDIKASYDFGGTAHKAFMVTRTGNLVEDYIKRLALLIYPENINLRVNLDSSGLSKFVSVVSGQDSVDPVEPSIKLIKGTIQITKGSSGKEVDQKLLETQIYDLLAGGKTSDINIPIKIIGASLSDPEVANIKARAEKYLGANVKVNFEFNTFTLSDSDLVELLDPYQEFNNDKIDSFLAKTTAQVEREPENPKFNFENGRVTEFSPARDGIKVDTDNFKNLLMNSFAQIEDGNKTQSFDIPVIRTASEVTTGSVNNLGIKELIGRGTSTYYHSISSRVHNISLAAERINGTLVKPGDTFSFNETLGDVSSFTGYQQAYIISEGKTILGDGGGVCQVSTTLFRALLNAGLHISDRTAHAYRVGYYEQNSPPGIDATVYGPSPDLKFVNNTSNYVLVEVLNDPKHYSLVIEIYGTSDGRVATITKPVITDITPALPTVYQDDPTLPAGTTKQVDYAAKGAKVIFKYIVTRNGESLENRTFTSLYKPWAAVYLRGTAGI